MKIKIKDFKNKGDLSNLFLHIKDQQEHKININNIKVIFKLLIINQNRLKIKNKLSLLIRITLINSNKMTFKILNKQNNSNNKNFLNK